MRLYLNLTCFNIPGTKIMIIFNEKIAVLGKIYETLDLLTLPYSKDNNDFIKLSALKIKVRPWGKVTFISFQPSQQGPQAKYLQSVIFKKLCTIPK